LQTGKHFSREEETQNKKVFRKLLPLIVEIFEEAFRKERFLFARKDAYLTSLKVLQVYQFLNL
jgi:hypothetical protein